MTVSLPPGSLPPGTTILIINAGNGYVLSFTVGNDGGAEETLPATISDRLLVTITDPFGNVTTFERSQFVNPATGETAVGPGGGVVTASDGSGVELRIPADATDKGVTLKIAGMTAADLAAEFPGQQPDLPGATVASGLKIESQDKPTFKREIDLVFPKPADAPDGAFYYVFRRIARTDGTALFETIDHAFVECPAGQTTCADADKKVVTASFPFGGYATSFGFIGPSGILAAVAFNHVFLMWTFNSLLPNVPSSGVVTGKVLQAAFASGGSGVTYSPMGGAVVTATDGSGRPLLADNAVIAVTPPAEPAPSADRAGRFTFLDPPYTGGTVEVAAALSGTPGPCPGVETPDDTTRCIIALEANPADWSTSGLRVYRHIASGNVTFPAPPSSGPPPAVRMQLFRKGTEPRQEMVSGIVVQNVPLEMDLDAGTARLGDVRMAGRSCVVQYLDPLQTRGRVDLETGDCAAGTVGTHRIEATAQPVMGSTVTASKSFLVVAPGGGNTESLSGPPGVLSVTPLDRATGVAVSILPQVTFSEPVRVGGGVRLETTATPPVVVALGRVLGITPDGQVRDVLAARELVTAITLEPASGLAFGKTYRLVLDSTIEDTDGDDLVESPTSFTTFTPELLPGSSETFGSPGIAVVQDRAYLVENFFSSGILRAFDISNPTVPREVPSAQASVTLRPVDITGQEDTTLVGRRLVLVATGPTAQSKPSNVWMFDTSSDAQSRWIGAVSVTSSAVDGYINRLTVRGGFAYAATAKKGVQVIDLQQAASSFAPCCGTDYWNMVRGLNTDGQGFGQQAVVQTVAVRTASGAHAWMADLEVGDFVADGASQPMVVATGEIPLVVVNPQTGTLYPRVPVQTSTGGELTYGHALGIGTAGGKRIAAIVGTGRAFATASVATVLAVVDLSVVAAPVTLAVIDLSSETCLRSGFDDLLIDGDRALVGAKECVGIVSLSDPAQPVIAGTVAGVGGRLAMSGDGIILSTARSVFGGSNPMGGVRTAALGSIVLLVDGDGRALSPLRLPKNSDAFVRARVSAAVPSISGVQVSIIERDGSVRRQTGAIPTQATLTLQRDASGDYLAPLRIVDKDCALELAHNAIDEQVVSTPCQADLESGPWSRLRIKMPVEYGGLERVTDIRAFRLVALGDSLTQGVQHGIVVHQDQRHSYPAQLADRINEHLFQRYGQRVVFKQAMIAEPGIGKPPLGNPWGDGPGDANGDGFPDNGRLNPGVQPVNNLGLSGSRVKHLHTARAGRWPTYLAESPWVCDEEPEKCATYPSPISNPDEPKSVWPYVLKPPDVQGDDFGTAVDQACQLDPSLLLILIGNNDALNAPVASNRRELTSVTDFQSRYNALIEAVLGCTEGRASIVVGTIPDVATIPHMRDVGEVVGPLPFTLPAPAFAETLTRVVENMYLDPTDEFDEPHGGNAGLCEGAGQSGPKIGIATLFKNDKIKKILGQTKLVTLLRGPQSIKLSRDEVMDPGELCDVQQHVDRFNDHVKRRAGEQGWPVEDMNQLFKERNSDAARNDPARLNGLFTGTPRALRLEGDEFLRGLGNTMLGWDGVHPNSAGYSVAANEAIRVLNEKLRAGEYGGLEKEAVIARVPQETITRLLRENYLMLPRTRIRDWQISTVE